MQINIILEKIQLNLINSESYRVEVIFRRIEFSNYRELDIKYIPPKMIIISAFLSNIYSWCSEERSGPKTFVFIDEIIHK